jgi:hypothetical protein
MPYVITDGQLEPSGEMARCLALIESWFREMHGQPSQSLDALSLWLAATCSLAKGEWEHLEMSDAVAKLDHLMTTEPLRAFDLACESITATRLAGWKADLIALVVASQH